MALIDIDYQDTLKKADRLESLANDLQSISTRNLQDLQASMSRTWRGSASELCKKRTQTFSRQIEAQAKELQNMARSLRASADRYRRLEALANSIFGH